MSGRLRKVINPKPILFLALLLVTFLILSACTGTVGGDNNTDRGSGVIATQTPGNATAAPAGSAGGTGSTGSDNGSMDSSGGTGGDVTPEATPATQ